MSDATSNRDFLSMPSKWSDLTPDVRMLTALESAGPRTEAGVDQASKRQWSEKFAGGCAVMIANELRQRKLLRKFKIFPLEDGSKSEYQTAARGRGRGKRVDVAVSSLATGMTIGFSLKGSNFPDPGDGGYGKNLTGRLYELLDEIRALHEYHPHATVTCIYYLPIQAATDKKQVSTLARTVAALRTNTGRDDPLQVTQFNHFDAAFVGLYAPHGSGSDIAPGVCRYFDVLKPPPKVGRPRLELTLSLDEALDQVLDDYAERERHRIDYSEPES